MRIGAVLPTTEIGSDPAALRDFAQAVEALGFSQLLLYDHVLGADPDRPGGWQGPYTIAHPFHEVFVTIAYLAAATTTLEFATCVLVLPQRQTALVAKQAAQLAVLSGDRFRLGIGSGWNYVEYEALDQNFHNRGRRQEEQVALMRRLWTEPVVDFQGEFHTVSRAGIDPRPRRPIPVWFGGSAEPQLKRAARIGDGWSPRPPRRPPPRPIASPSPRPPRRPPPRPIASAATSATRDARRTISASARNRSSGAATPTSGGPTPSAGGRSAPRRSPSPR